ncbi:hypothetical protein Pmani_018047 [Petrolisthes manimaculis]|uniref:Uncharacterized protein n=1 Tax=Petrolisthes manimaculis TaxID=1843537 RepID=A0AAE1U8R9_9EUCA|nr:hypothetical protein Pmani_018047 [Petrolisthes manimaculis]
MPDPPQSSVLWAYELTICLNRLTLGKLKLRLPLLPSSSSLSPRFFPCPLAFFLSPHLLPSLLTCFPLTSTSSLFLPTFFPLSSPSSLSPLHLPSSSSLSPHPPPSPLGHSSSAFDGAMVRLSYPGAKCHDGRMRKKPVTPVVPPALTGSGYSHPPNLSIVGRVLRKSRVDRGGEKGYITVGSAKTGPDWLCIIMTTTPGRHAFPKPASQCMICKL